MGKAELRKTPGFSIFFKRMNIAVDRGNARSSHQAYERAKTDLQKGISIAIFPEATIPACSPKLGPMKNGAFRLAIETGTPILPITFLDNWKLWPDSGKRRFLVRPGLSRVIIHEPIETKHLNESHVSELRSTFHELISRSLEKEVIDCNKMQHQISDN